MDAFVTMVMQGGQDGVERTHTISQAQSNYAVNCTGLHLLLLTAFEMKIPYGVAHLDHERASARATLLPLGRKRSDGRPQRLRLDQALLRRDLSLLRTRIRYEHSRPSHYGAAHPRTVPQTVCRSAAPPLRHSAICYK